MSLSSVVAKNGALYSSEAEVLYEEENLVDMDSVTKLYVDLWSHKHEGAVFTYNVDGNLETVEQQYRGKTRTITFFYNGDNISSIQIDYDGHRRTETYSYTGDNISSIAVVEEDIV